MFQKKNLANLITLSRIFGVSLIFFLTPFTTNLRVVTVALLFALVGFTDFLDGWIARRYKTVSDLGKVLDPLADKLLILVFLPLLSTQVITSVPVFIILAREFCIMALRVVAAKQNIIIAANFTGKLKTGLTLPLCGILIGRIPVTDIVAIPWLLKPMEMLRHFVLSWPQWFIDAYIWFTVAVTIWSFLDYFVKFMWSQQLKFQKGDEKKTKQFFYAWIPNSLTVLNVCCGFIAIYYVMVSQLNWAIFFIFLGSLLDITDGKLARKLGVNSKLGQSLDSRADLISFGIAPGAIIYGFYSSLAPTWAAIGLGALFSVAVYYRLRRFNDTGHTDYFDGIPSTAAAIATMFMLLMPWSTQAWMSMGFIIIISILMVSKIQYMHMSKAITNSPLKVCKWPALACFFGTWFELFGATWNPIVPFSQLYFAFCMIYILSPFYLKKT